MRIAVTGAAGMLAQAVIATARRNGHEVLPLDRKALDVTDGVRVHDVITRAQPDAVIHCAAYTRVDDAESDPEGAARLNAVSTRYVAAAAANAGAVFIYPSTDYVFDGMAAVPYTPDSPTAPLSVYGSSKLAGEAAAAFAERHYVVRTSWLYGRGGANFVSTMLKRGRARTPLRVVDDQRGTPTWTADLAPMMLALLERGAPSGIWHASSTGDTTWFGFARAIFDLAGIDADLQPTTSDVYVQKARRPRYSVLDCTATYRVTGPAPHWRDSLARALQELAA